MFSRVYGGGGLSYGFVSAPVFLFAAQTIAPSQPYPPAVGDRVLLSGSEARHALSARRLRAGERVDLVDGKGMRLQCTVVAAAPGEKDMLAVRVQTQLQEPAPAVSLILVQALAKGGRDEQAVETATQVGVDQVIPWQAQRSIARWQGSKLVKGVERWRRTAQAAAKQARRAFVPQILLPVTTAQLANWVQKAVAANTLVLLAHEEASTSMGQALAAMSSPDAVAVIVGPEGGIAEGEIAQLCQAGASLIRLGPHVFRTATAGSVALAVIAQRVGMWD